MDIAAKVLLLVLALAAASLWVPVVSARCARWPWWTLAGALVVLLGAAAWCAGRAAPGSLGELGWALTVAVAVLGGNPVATSILRGARGSAVPAPMPPASRTEGVSTDRSPEEILRGGQRHWQPRSPCHPR